jgi:hypothetical protein
VRYRPDVRRLVPLLHAALLLAMVPALAHPFSWPKLAVLCIGAIAALLLPKTESQAKAGAPLLWLGLVATAALVHPIEL